jgi:hypothetical protein
MSRVLVAGNLGGSKGRDFLAGELGLPVNWYFRPSKLKHCGYNPVVHNLVLTRFFVAAHVWALKRPDFRLVQTRIGYDLATEAAAAFGHPDVLSGLRRYPGIPQGRWKPGI